MERWTGFLVDAPCSNTGVLSRRPEARYRVDERALRELTAIQARVLDLAGELARPGTRLLYATCSLEPEKMMNRRQRRLRVGNSGWVMMDSELTLPHHDGPVAKWQCRRILELLGPSLAPGYT
jgi:16S rRNA C967 or C1407 C5-methylase (RsmB/RsmF family)